MLRLDVEHTGSISLHTHFCVTHHLQCRIRTAMSEGRQVSIKGTLDDLVSIESRYYSSQSGTTEMAECSDCSDS
jgi:hypothetical protein